MFSLSSSTHVIPPCNRRCAITSGVPPTGWMAARGFECTRKWCPRWHRCRWPRCGCCYCCKLAGWYPAPRVWSSGRGRRQWSSRCGGCDATGGPRGWCCRGRRRAVRDCCTLCRVSETTTEKQKNNESRFNSLKKAEV